MPAFLTLENISKYYASGQSVVMGLHGINLEFALGEFVAVTGESGSGKSTLAKVIAGILSYENGEMSVNGKPTSHYGLSDWEQYRSRRISFISQSYDILPGCTVIENVVSALILTGMDKQQSKKRAEEILAQVELLDKRKRRASKLSSGQKQRLSIARALAKPAPILIADEPTGNLDSENSAKVIQLLADAAKERLVIMVTHDFNEAQEFATRRITIRDGVVEADVRLRQAAVQNVVDGQTSTEQRQVEQDIADRQIVSAPAGAKQTLNTSSKKQKSPNLSRYTAFLQMISRPIWSVIMLFFFALTAFAFFAFAGTFVVNIDDNFTRTYDTSAFANGSKNRIVVVREDRTDMTQADYDTLLALPYVEYIERYGFLSDINLYYRDGVDYERHYEAVVDDFGSPTGEIKVTLTLGNTNIFLQTVPCLPEGAHFLTSGRLPENMYEVVAVGEESLIGTDITFYIRNKKKWSADAYIEVNATVVGVTDVGRHLYVAEQLGRALTWEYCGGDVVFAPIYDIPYNKYITGDDPMNGRFLCSVSMESLLMDQLLAKFTKKGWGAYNLTEEYYKSKYPFLEDQENPIVLRPYGVHTSSYKFYYLVKPETFEQIVPDIQGGVISLIISDYAYTDRVLNAVHELGYPAISPYQVGSTKQNEKLAAERLQTLKICILASLAVFFLQVLVLRAMFGMETVEFKLLANIGLRCHTAKRSIFWQVFLFTVGGQLLAFAVIFAASKAQVARIVQIVKYLPANYILLFMLIHLATGFLAALWIQHFIGRQVYPSSLQYADLDLDKDEEEEEEDQ